LIYQIRGTDLRKTNADVILYSMYKASGAPTAGLIIGKEEVMISLRRTLGVHGDRWGIGAPHGKATY
jgi:seryl-tRNA(Sec) selenium transferase